MKHLIPFMGTMASGFPLSIENESFRVRCFSLKRFRGPSVSVQRATGFLNMKPRKERPREAPAPPATPTRRRERLGDKETGGGTGPPAQGSHASGLVG